MEIRVIGYTIKILIIIQLVVVIAHIGTVESTMIFHMVLAGIIRILFTHTTIIGM